MARFAVPTTGSEKHDTAFVKPELAERRFHALAPISEHFVTHRRTVPLLSNISAQRVLEEYTGEVEAVEGGLVMLTLYSGGIFYEAELSENVFAPGALIEPGSGVLARKIQQRDDLVTWAVEVLPKKKYLPEELAEEQEKLAVLFDGTGL